MQLFPEGKFVFLWRNPLSVVASMIEVWGPWHPTFMSSDLFIGMPRLIATYEANRDRVHAARFEDLSGGDESRWRELMSYLGIEFDRDALAGFAKIELGGRMGDPTGRKLYSTLSTDPQHKWKSTLANPLRREWCRRYLRFLGAERLATMGYDLEAMVAELDSQPASLDAFAPDLWRAARDVAKEPIRVRTRSRRLGTPSVIRRLLRKPDAASRRKSSLRHAISVQVRRRRAGAWRRRADEPRDEPQLWTGNQDLPCDRGHGAVRRRLGYRRCGALTGRRTTCAGRSRTLPRGEVRQSRAPSHVKARPGARKAECRRPGMRASTFRRDGAGGRTGDRARGADLDPNLNGVPRAARAPRRLRHKRRPIQNPQAAHPTTPGETPFRFFPPPASGTRRSPTKPRSIRNRPRSLAHSRRIDRRRAPGWKRALDQHDQTTACRSTPCPPTNRPSRSSSSAGPLPRPASGMEREVPLPPEAQPSAGSDQHLVVWQPSSDRLWEFWSRPGRRDLESGLGRRDAERLLKHRRLRRRCLDREPRAGGDPQPPRSRSPVA